MRPVDRGPIPKQPNGKDIVFSCYQDAKSYLLERLGTFCSYCERKFSASLAVEHIQPKSLQVGKECQWNNFLLACTNCNSTKSAMEINDNNIGNYLWPDTDNTFMAFEYTEAGEVKVNKNIPPTIQPQAQATLHLVGLDKNPQTGASASDLRWKDRLDAWGKATRAKQRLTACPPAYASVMRAQIEDTAHDHFSIWMTVFKDDPNMCRRLINKFKGTAKNCFDNNGQPQNRQGGQL